VIVPIGRGEDGLAPLARARGLAKELAAVGVRAHVDARDASPGFKFNDWELKGVPVRAEIGPRDLEAGQVLVAERLGPTDEAGRPLKEALPFDGFVSGMGDRLAAYHDRLVARALEFRDEHSRRVDDADAFAAQVATGFAYALHCGRPECEADIQARTTATPRCVPIDGEPEEGACVQCGSPSSYGTRVLFARAY